jgi:hypothetical protein
MAGADPWCTHCDRFMRPDHYCIGKATKEVTPTLSDLLTEMKKQTALLEQIARSLTGELPPHD